MKYELNDRPGGGAMLLYGFQWWLVTLPNVVIMGVVVGRLHFTEVGEQVFYLQKLLGFSGLAALAQTFLGHRLPLVVGPATILLVGLTASLSSGPPALYTAIMIGGAAVAMTAGLGLLTSLRVLFTPRVVSVILLLIAVTLSPTILNLALSGGERPAFHLVLTLGLAVLMVLINQILPGVWKSLTVFFGLAGGCLIYYLMTPLPDFPDFVPAARQALWPPALDFQAGTIVAFLLCMVALIINELGSIESIGQMLRADDMPGRVRRGVLTGGLANMAAGACGVMGSVSYSMSAGIISATECAARLTLAPAGLGLLACAFFPQAVYVFAQMPGVVMSAILLYLMAGQMASGLIMMTAANCVGNFADGVTVSLPLIMGVMIACAPPAVFAEVPLHIRPIVANGFVMGTATVVLLEHVIFRKR